MEKVKTKKRLTEMTRDEKEREFQKLEEEKQRRLQELDAPELTQEEKELLIDIKLGLEDEDEETTEETLEILFGAEGICR